MKKETRVWLERLIIAIAISVVFVIIIEAVRESARESLVAKSIQATTTTYTPPELTADLIRAQSPLHRCVATMADINVGAIIDVYNVNFGQMVDDGVIVSDPYPVTVGSSVEYIINVSVDGEIDQRSLGDLGLVPYVPWGVWNRANFTVVSGEHCPVPLP